MSEYSVRYRDKVQDRGVGVNVGYTIVKGDITEFKGDIIVNASNGVGYMGGFIGKYIKLKGVAEAIHYKTKGIVEREAKEACGMTRFINWRTRNGIKAGEVFVTRAGNLQVKHIIHAITMPFPGMTTGLGVVQELLPKICEKARELGAKTVAIPLLGTGTGGVPKEDVLKMFEEFFSKVSDLEVKIIVL